MWQLYRFLLILFTPVLLPYFFGCNKYRYSRARFNKSRTRPNGPLLWVHAASIGEVFTALTLLDRLCVDAFPNGNVLLTTQTVSSAKLVNQCFRTHHTLRERGVHCFFPFDHPLCVWFFLRRWSPDIAMFLESELWPIMLFALRRRGRPTFLVSARLSEKSFARWKCVPESSRKQLWRCFSGIFAQSAQNVALFRALSAKNVISSGNLKYAASALPCNEPFLRLFREKTAKRPLWVAASLHPGEEKIIFAAHKQLKSSFPSLLTILAPRHSKHTADLMRRLRKESVVQHSSGILPEPWQEFYVVDTFGELGTFYRLADIVLIGGSFVPIGGHNLIEPAQLECAILHGPYMSKCQEIAALFHQQVAAIQVNNASEIASAVKGLLEHPDRCTALKAAAKDLVNTQRRVFDAFEAFVAPYFQRLKQG